jgi:hypothetical protein
MQYKNMINVLFVAGLVLSASPLLANKNAENLAPFDSNATTHLPVSK